MANEDTLSVDITTDDLPKETTPVVQNNAPTSDDKPKETPTEQPKDAETPQEEEPPKEETTSDDEKFTLTDVVINDKGQFVWKVNPDDPKSTVYVGNTLNELMKNVAKGIVEKDTYIGKLKTERLSPDAVKGKRVTNDEADEVVNPQIDMDRILTDVAKDFNIDPKFFRYTDEDWRNREQEVGAVVASREANRVEQALLQANQRYAEANIDFINDRSLDLETAQVEEVVREMGLEDEFTPEQYETILMEIYSNKENFRKNGLRKPGVVVKEVVKHLSKTFKENVSKHIATQKDEKLAAERLKKEKIRVVTKTKSTPQITEKAPKTIQEAAEQILKELNLR